MVGGIVIISCIAASCLFDALLRIKLSSLQGANRQSQTLHAANMRFCADQVAKLTRQVSFAYGELVVCLLGALFWVCRVSSVAVTSTIIMCLRLGRIN